MILFSRWRTCFAYHVSGSRVRFDFPQLEDMEIVKLRHQRCFAHPVRSTVLDYFHSNSFWCLLGICFIIESAFFFPCCGKLYVCFFKCFDETNDNTCRHTLMWIASWTTPNAPRPISLKILYSSFKTAGVSSSREKLLRTGNAGVSSSEEKMLRTGGPGGRSLLQLAWLRWWCGIFWSRIVFIFDLIFHCELLCGNHCF